MREHQTIVYRCKCDCGNYKNVNINKLHSGHVTSCGCQQYPEIKDLTGKRFGRLIVNCLYKHESNKTLWSCTCDCGHTCIKSSSALISGATISCGCRNKEIQANIFKMDTGFIDGTNINAIQEDRKLNKNNTSGIRGVHYEKNRHKWVAQITFQNKIYLLGRFEDKKTAIQYRKAAEDNLFGKYRNRK